MQFKYGEIILEKSEKVKLKACAIYDNINKKASRVFYTEDGL